MSGIIRAISLCCQTQIREE